MRVAKWLLLIIFIPFAELRAQNGILNTSCIYQIFAKKSGSNNLTAETGFQCDRFRGIVTTLHGVVGSSNIYAVNEKGTMVGNLSIAQVDVANDIAILTSSDLVTSQNVLVTIKDRQLSTGQKLSVVGHPVGMKFNIKTVTLGRPIFEALDNLIPRNSRRNFSARNSPASQTQIIYLEGSIVPGQSGAPLLDGNRVLGIADGGILEGAAGISWAIPIDKVKPKNVSEVQAQLLALARLNTTDLFSTEIIEDNLVGPKLVYNFSPLNIPYAMGEYDYDSKLYKIQFRQNGCIQLKYHCTEQPLCVLEPGKYVCEFTYRSENPVITAQESYDKDRNGFYNLMAYILKDNDKDIAERQSGIVKDLHLNFRLIPFDASDYANGKFKVTRLNFTIDKNNQSIACPMFTYNVNWTLFIKSIKIYALQ